MNIRNEIERVVIENRLNRLCVFECSKLTYLSIIAKIEQTFVLHGGHIHWSNMGNGYNPKFPCETRNISEDRMWIEKLPRIVPNSEELVFVLFEDTKNYRPKYWIYEMCLPELICIIGEIYGLNDFYIVSKKFDWLISECHEDIVSCVGRALSLSCFTK